MHTEAFNIFGREYYIKIVGLYSWPLHNFVRMSKHNDCSVDTTDMQAHCPNNRLICFLSAELMVCWSPKRELWTESDTGFGRTAV